MRISVERSTADKKKEVLSSHFVESSRPSLRQFVSKSCLSRIRSPAEVPPIYDWQLHHRILLFFVGQKNRVNLVLFFKPYGLYSKWATRHWHVTNCRNVNRAGTTCCHRVAQQIVLNSIYSMFIPSNAAHTKFRHFLTLCCFGMLAQIKICHTVMFRMCCSRFCKQRGYP